MRRIVVDADATCTQSDILRLSKEPRKSIMAEYQCGTPVQVLLLTGWYVVEWSPAMVSGDIQAESSSLSDILEE